MVRESREPMMGRVRSVGGVRCMGTAVRVMVVVARVDVDRGVGSVSRVARATVSTGWSSILKQKLVKGVTSKVKILTNNELQTTSLNTITSDEQVFDTSGLLELETAALLPVNNSPKLSG